MIEQLDVGELLSGFQIGKSLRLADWSERRDRREFARLCNALGCIKRRNDDRAENGERWANYLEVRRRIDRSPERRAKAAKRKRQGHREGYEANPLATCAVCGSTWVRPFRKGRVRMFCGPACRRDYKRAKERRNRAKRRAART